MRSPSGFIRPGFDPLKTPDAPTIGTATPGNTFASVVFTAPPDVGGSAITAYSVVSTPGGFAGTGASSPVTVSGLTNGTAYTFKVIATNSYGLSVASAASNSVTPVLAIGDAFGGGFFAGQISTTGNGVADYNLVVGPAASAQDTSKQWKNAYTATSGADSVIDGPQNTADMVAEGNATVYPAAHFCNNLTIGGFSDWYMPSWNELEICYYNLKPTTSNNTTLNGSNTNAVPSRGSNYTTGTPAQTSVASFVTLSGAEAFLVTQIWWASTESSDSAGYIQNFETGIQSANGKINYRYVRAVRRVAV
tara:strand:+ start:571 stop:1488 length:918 start_codon:yes stop_codon:yes gene_type:complete